MEAAPDENITSNASVPVGVPGQSEIPPSHACDTRTGIARTEEPIHNWRIDEHEHGFREEPIHLKLANIDDATSNCSGTNPAAAQNRWETVYGGGCGGVSVRPYGSKEAISYMVPGIANSKETPEGVMPTKTSGTLQDVPRKMEPIGKHVPGRRWALCLGLFFADPQLYDIRSIPTPPAFFPMEALECSLHSSGVSTHLEYPHNDTDLLEGIADAVSRIS